MIANCESACILDGYCEAWLRMFERPETVANGLQTRAFSLSFALETSIAQWLRDTTSCYADSCMSQKIRQTLKV